MYNISLHRDLHPEQGISLPADWAPSHSNSSEISVRTDEIIVDPAYQMRAKGTNPGVVQRYANVMKQNDPDGWLAFPLIKLLKRHDANEQMFLVSGFHRLEAIKRNGYKEINASVFNGTHIDGILLAAGENADRSLPRTNKDIQEIVETFLIHPELSQWSNAQIARWAGVDSQTVSNHEQRLRSSPYITIRRPEKLKFIDKHGNISLRKAPTYTSDPPKRTNTTKITRLSGAPTSNSTLSIIQALKTNLQLLIEKDDVKVIVQCAAEEFFEVLDLYIPTENDND